MRARFLLYVLALSALASAGFAEEGRGPPSLDRVLPEIRRTTPGTFYDADGPFLGPNGQAAYRIKWMTPDGRIVWFYADARTGHVIGMGGSPSGPFPPPPGRDYPSRHFRDNGDWPPGNGGHWNQGEHGGRNWNGGGGNWHGRDRDRGPHG